MNTFFIKIAEFFGLFDKIKRWLQGKKTYAVNIQQAFIALGSMLGASVILLDCAAQSIGIMFGWVDSGQSIDAAIKAVQGVWISHPLAIGTFLGGWYALSDAFSKMSAYAASQRRVKEVLGPSCPSDFVEVKQEIGKI